MLNTEPSVQVPVSFIDTLRDLIERNADYDPANPNARRSWDHGIDCDSIEWGWDGIEGDSGDPCDCWVSVVADLLSQPTPNAEPNPWPTQGEFAADGTYSSADTLRRRWTPAAPPSIADMAPGTYRSIVQLTEGSTFYARQHGDPQERFWFLAAGMGVVSLDAIMAHANSIDPSTIRDVTPPSQ